ncbi:MULTISPECIES: hypothetical protein [Burkholderia]|uniref:Ribbon-helix-helix protein, CopG family n=1 Tax=Burkholderia gladioli TaxID=28095 RepID=A0AB38TQY5_BURGA|nr:MULTISPECIES: hypothetical protein [Burkholderia]UVT00409.1 hypothetical protein EFP20_01200 [Burkholderia glumae]UWX70325.1 hypothetical protein NYZ96_00660 [Burkholderia gladioli]
MTTATAKGPRRSKRGTLSDKPLYVRLTPAERREVEQFAEARHRSMSSMGRDLMLLGLAQLRMSAAPRPRTGGQ